MLIHEKADQAQALLTETGLGCWLTFARETELLTNARSNSNTCPACRGQTV